MSSPKVLYCVMGIQISVLVLLMGYFICNEQYLQLTHQIKPIIMKAKQVQEQEQKCIQLVGDNGEDIQLGLGSRSHKVRTLYVDTTARTGNLLFQIAGSYAMAHDAKARLAFTNYSILDGFKDLPFDIITSEQVPQVDVVMIKSRHNPDDYVAAFKALLSCFIS